MKLSFKKLNAFGATHLVVPIVAVLVVGGIGTYVGIKSFSHADAAIPNLICSVSLSSARVPTRQLISGNASSSYNRVITATLAMRNAGGGYTGVIRAQLQAGGSTTASVPVGQNLDPVVHLHGLYALQSRSWSYTFYYNALKSPAYAPVYGTAGNYQCMKNLAI
jgi:hypothetical protein